MTTPVEDILEPFAISFKNDPADGPGTYLRVSQGRTLGGAALAWVPTAAITVYGAMTNIASGALWIRHADGSGTMLRSLTGNPTAFPMTTFSTKPGDTLRFMPSTDLTGKKAELLLTVIPMPFSK